MVAFREETLTDCNHFLLWSAFLGIFPAMDPFVKVNT